MTEISSLSSSYKIDNNKISQVKNLLSQPSTVNPTDRSTTIKHKSLLQKEKFCKNHLRHDDYQDGTTHTEKRMSFPNEL